MTLSNREIEKLGYEEVEKYERARGQTDIGKAVGKPGYDLISKGPHGELHIEVKAKTAKSPDCVWLSENEFKTMEDDEKFRLYVVYDVYGKPRVRDFTREETRDRKEEKKWVEYRISFRKGDFPDNKEALEDHGPPTKPH